MRIIMNVRRRMRMHREPSAMHSTTHARRLVSQLRPTLIFASPNHSKLVKIYGPGCNVSDQYFLAANINDSITQASTLANALSNEVHAALYKLKLPSTIWNDPSMLKPYYYNSTMTAKRLKRMRMNSATPDKQIKRPSLSSLIVSTI